MGVGVAGVSTGVIVLAWLVLLSGYDIRERRLPNALTLPGAGVVVLAAFLTGRGLAAVAGAAALAGVYLLVHVVAPSAMGAGDVKLALGLGALTGGVGVEVWVPAAMGAPLLTAAWGVGAMLRGVRTVPHGPSMCVASALALALGLGF